MRMLELCSCKTKEMKLKVLDKLFMFLDVKKKEQKKKITKLEHKRTKLEK